jgi:hypothetical protein
MKNAWLGAVESPYKTRTPYKEGKTIICEGHTKCPNGGYVRTET